MAYVFKMDLNIFFLQLWIMICTYYLCILLLFFPCKWKKNGVVGSWYIMDIGFYY
jgi:hypothetical protein